MRRGIPRQGDKQCIRRGGCKEEEEAPPRLGYVVYWEDKEANGSCVEWVGLEEKILAWDCQVGGLGRGSLADRKDYGVVTGSSPREQRVPMSPKALEQGPVLHLLGLRYKKPCVGQTQSLLHRGCPVIPWVGIHLWHSFH